jgi:REP element-mobilizing transposase RayT
MGLNLHGHVAEECWRAIPAHFPNVELGAYAIMPNHVHGIIVIQTGGAQHAAPGPAAPAPIRKVMPGSLGAIIRSFKSAVARDLGRRSGLANVWQRNYYEHILRNGKEMARIWDYIESNPANWNSDKQNR